MPSGTLYRWEFEKHGEVISLDVPGMLTLDHPGLMVAAAADDLGIAYVAEHAARQHLDAGRLTPVLSDWCPPVAGLFVYYSGRRQVPGPLRAFIEVLRERMP